MECSKSEMRNESTPGPFTRYLPTAGGHPPPTTPTPPRAVYLKGHMGPGWWGHHISSVEVDKPPVWIPCTAQCIKGAFPNREGMKSQTQTNNTQAF